MPDAHVHLIPVDPALTPEEAWRELCLMHVRATWTGPETWASVECDGEECREIAHAPNYRRFHNDREVTHA